MKPDSSVNLEQSERIALKFSVFVNLAMGVAGVITAKISNSQAILVDGLLALVGTIAALAALWVSHNLSKQPDRVRPFGYSADESIFTTFRALSLLGLILYAITNAIGHIFDYLNGKEPIVLNSEPLFLYLVFVLVSCISLWGFHYHSWIKSGKSSEILKLEANAAAFDGLLTITTAVGVWLIVYSENSSFSFIAALGDSILVLLLCIVASYFYLSDFRRGLAELAGVAAAPRFQEQVENIISPFLESWEGKLLELAILKSGRSFFVVAFIKPQHPVSGNEVDILSNQIVEALCRHLGQAEVLVVISDQNPEP